MATINVGNWLWPPETGRPFWVLTQVTILVCLRILWLTVYRLFLHPLAKYPGPLASKLSDLPAIYYAASMQDTYARYAQHQRYGKVVRTGPNELCFADAESIKDIYGQGSDPCLKVPWFYDGFTLTGTSSVFGATDRNLHARMRRLLSSGLSQQGVLQFQSHMVERIEKFLHVVSSSPQPFNIYAHAHNLYLDITSQLSFGKSFGILDGKKSQGSKDIQTYFSIAPVFGRFPLAKYLPFGIFRAAREARPRVIDFSQSCIDALRERLRQGTAQQSLLRNMVEAKDGETDTAFSDAELIENVVIFIVGGSETTASTLLYLIYELGKRPKMQARLEQEIRRAFPDQSVFPDLEIAKELPYLNNVVSEVLRLDGPLPSVGPRLSPGKVIAGQYVPAGVVVSNIAYTTHRDPLVWPDPTTFDPDRWQDPTPEMKALFRPFSNGPRNCIGVHLAKMQLLMTVCAMYQRLDITLDKRTTEEMMVLRDQGMMTPVGKQLWVTTRPRK